MTRLIDADSIRYKIEKRMDDEMSVEYLEGLMEAIDFIDIEPSITQGHWRSIGFEKGYAFCICSKCGKTIRLVRDSKNEFCCLADIREKAIACLYCGAYMRGDKE